MKRRDLKEVVKDIWFAAGLERSKEDQGSPFSLVPEYKEYDGRSYWSPVSVMIQTDHLIELVHLAGLEHELPFVVNKKRRPRKRVKLK